MSHTPPDDPTLFRVFNEIAVIDQLARATFDRVMPYGLKISQFFVLNHMVRLGEGKRPGDFANAFQVTRGAITNTLRRLEALAFIEIRPDPEDGRAKAVFLTDAGRAARHEAIAALAPTLNELEREIGAPRFADVLPFLTTLRQTLDAKR